jgi:hypothetical protein
VLWLLTYDDERFSLTEAVDKYSVGVPPSLWLPWIPQLLTCLARNEGKYIVNLISQVSIMNSDDVVFGGRHAKYEFDKLFFRRRLVECFRKRCTSLFERCTLRRRSSKGSGTRVPKELPENR